MRKLFFEAKKVVNKHQYSDFSIRLGRTTYYQIKDGVGVARGDYITAIWTKQDVLTYIYIKLLTCTS